MYEPKDFLWCMDLKWGAGLFGALATVSAVETLFYTDMDMMTMFFWIMIDISVHTAWVLIILDNKEKYRKGLYYAAKMGFYCACAVYVAVEFMLFEILSFLRTAKRVQDLSESNAYAMLPGLMRLEETATEEMEIEEEDDADEIKQAIMWMRLMMVLVVVVALIHYYFVAITYSYWKNN